MALLQTIGTTAADTGMSKAIYDQLDQLLSPPLQQAVDSAKGPAKEGAEKALDAAREGWKKLSFAIAKGVIEHLVANMEVFGITAQGNVSVPVQGNTGTANPDNHLHSVNITGVANNVVFTQNNDGTGRIR